MGLFLFIAVPIFCQGGLQLLRKCKRLRAFEQSRLSVRAHFHYRLTLLFSPIGDEVIFQRLGFLLAVRLT